MSWNQNINLYGPWNSIHIAGFNNPAQVRLWRELFLNLGLGATAEASPNPTDHE